HEQMSNSPPLSARRSPEALQDYAALIEGYPQHLHLAIDDWLYREAAISHSEDNIVRALVREFAVWRRKPFPASFRPQSDNIASAVRAAMKVDVEFALDLLDFLAGSIRDSARTGLESILRAGGSVYMVDPTGKAGLVRR